VGGQSAIRDATGQGNQLQNRGPYLIGWSPATSRGQKDAVVLVIDMSSYEEQTGFDQAFRFWRQKIVQDPGLWRNGFSTEGIRTTVQDFVNHYGKSIIDAIKFVTPSGKN
jgi:hypothetical protein